MVSFRKLLKKTERREALKTKLNRSIASGQFFRLRPAKRNNLLLKFYRLTKGISELKWQVKIAAVSSALISLTPFDKVQAQQIGPFLQQSRLANPLRQPLPGSRLKPATVDLDNDGDSDIVVGGNYGYLNMFVNDGTGNFEEVELLLATSGAYTGYISAGIPSFADLDGDGDLDLIVGQLYSNSHPTYYLNNGGGNGTTPTFTSQNGAWNGTTGNPFYSINPFFSQHHSFIDYDGDGDLDVFISGTANLAYDPQILYYENTGSSVFVNTSLPNLPTFYANDYGNRANALVADMDLDGSLDLIIGGAGGDITFFKGGNSDFVKQTAAWNPTTKTGNPFHDVLLVNGPLFPSLIDLDLDGDLDLIAGYSPQNYNAVEPVAYFENKGNSVFERKEFLDNPLGGASTGSVGTASFVDIDDDGEIDALLGGKYSNALSFFKNSNNVFSNTTTGSLFDGIAETFERWEGAIPVPVDLDDDGDLDLITGGYYGRITFFQNINGTLERQVMDSENPFHLVGSYDNFNYDTGSYYSVFLGGITYLDLVDIDNDGDVDLFVSSGNGTIKFFENTGDKENPSFEAPSNPGDNPLDVSHIPEFASGNFDNSRGISPKFVDLDHDGDLDLLLGGRQIDSYAKYDLRGIFLFENTGSASAATFVGQGYLIPDTDYRPSPSAVDADGDGDLDIFVGNDNGFFKYYVNENPAPVTAVNSSVIDYEFESGPVTLDASLALADSDGDDIARATVTIQNFQAGNEVLAFTPQSPITGSFDTSTGVLTLTGRASVTAYRNVLRTVTYNYIGPDPGPPNTGGRIRALTRTIAFAVYDQDLTTPALATKSVTISSPPVIAEEIIVYNGISPNGDAFNQFFNIENIETLGPENNVSIFNRWGDKVFEISNYNNDDRRFEGRSDDGKELSSGVYFYRIKFENGLPELKGYLTLKR
ncbi:MAG: VCBS repeat-containing protein [Cyclobacteriaceae bacterium]|nr:VCBS repeat-containing protein [Cyclobacteriaceae bacterium]